MSSAAAADERGSWVWATCGASVAGSMHMRKGLGCDDAFGYAVTGDFIVAAVADGAGSVSGTSAWGSYAACQSVLRDASDPGFINDFRAGPADRGQALMRWLFDGAVERVSAQAQSLGLDISLLATTLAVVIADRNLSVFGQIGDGIMASESAGRVATLLIEPKDEYANTTWFLQSERAFDESFRTTTQTGVTAFALSTDGMSYKITNISTGEAYEPFFRGSWEHVRNGASSANFEALLGGIEDDQTGDDKTMVLAAVRWEPGPTLEPQVRQVASHAPGGLPTPGVSPDRGVPRPGDDAEATTPIVTGPPPRIVRKPTLTEPVATKRQWLRGWRQK
ncbi:PP2C family serine/threonine-protein phosphatase [Mycolicibacterium llatzerense]|uniref:PP2C family serine/threonine-protein phosphatase n=1 Tax=Mycolicibacterium llatzerense TaxID=280871 RepID=UPI0021B67A61|nr:PP2C family serine/threonine-protein phosphatase [Mycolicibacterium llatzerense]MCT7363615.1 hypothetical protein [Mycolicibacterium llatzerense]